MLWIFFNFAPRSRFSSRIWISPDSHILDWFSNIAEAFNSLNRYPFNDPWTSLIFAVRFWSYREKYLSTDEEKVAWAQATFSSSVDKYFSLYDQNLTAKISDVQGSLNGYRFNELNASAIFENQSNIWESGDIQIRLENLDLGAKLKNIHSTLRP